MLNIAVALICILTTCLSSVQAIDKHHESAFAKTDLSHHTFTLSALDNIDFDDDLAIVSIPLVAHPKRLISVVEDCSTAIFQFARIVSIRAPPLKFI